MSLTVIRADSRQLPIPDDSVDLIVTSPPYFGLRSYTDGGVHYEGQVGSEATPAEFVEALLAVTRECVRVLKPSGSMWVNLGDKYASYEGNRGQGTIQGNEPRPTPGGGSGLAGGGLVRAKSLMGLPWRYALRCIDDLGLILRAEVIWSKPNGLPESVTDRVRRSHETWFHFTVSPRYFSAVDEIREPHLVNVSTYTGGHANRKGQAGVNAESNLNGSHPHPLGKLPGSVWTVPTEPLKVPEHLGVDHFAAFPTEWPKRIVQGWSPSGVCTACGEGRRPVVQKERMNGPMKVTGAAFQPDIRTETADGKRHQFQTDATITGYTCNWACSAAPTRPAVVLDPFGGTGTTAHVAHALDRHGISVDLSADYCRIASDPTVLDGRVRKVLGVTKPPPQVTGQADLFGEEVA